MDAFAVIEGKDQTVHAYCLTLVCILRNTMTSLWAITPLIPPKSLTWFFDLNPGKWP